MSVRLDHQPRKGGNVTAESASAPDTSPPGDDWFAAMGDVVNNLTTSLKSQLATLSDTLARITNDPGMLLSVGLAGAVSVLAILLWARRRAAPHRDLQKQFEATNKLLEGQLGELRGRLGLIAEISAQREAELTQSVNSRLDLVSDRLSRALNDTTHALARQLETSLTSQGQSTGHQLRELHQRLAVIDQAQANLTELSTRVVSLQDVLANKQARGAFGQQRMETIVEDGLPRSAFSFQATLSNGSRPDCLVHIPGAPGIAIDAKFPLEAFEALRTAIDESQTRHAMARVRQDVGRHVDEIARKYLIPGETQDTALMFVPSEWIYAELHERFADIIQRAYRLRVVIVSPNMLMLAVQTMQAILKDSAMREQSGVIQREVAALMEDVRRLADRARDLEKHFAIATREVEKILISTEKIDKRGQRIEALELDDAASGGPQVADVPATSLRKLATGS